MVAQTCKACKLAFYNIKRSRRLGLIPSAGIATVDTWFKCFCTKTFPANTCWCWLTCQHSAFHRPARFEWVSGNWKKRTVTLILCKTDTRISLRCHFIAASAKQDDCLIANDNPDLWFLIILLLLVRNDVIQLVEDNTADSLGLLRTVANFFKTLNRQISFLKQTNIP